MPRGYGKTIAASAALVSALALAMAGAALTRPIPAFAASVTPAPGAVVLTTDPPGAMHELTPGIPALWNVGVTLRRMPVSSFVGILTAEGGFGSTDGERVSADVELLGCGDAWRGTVCVSGAWRILPPIETGDLPSGALALRTPAQPIPAETWVQARVALRKDAPVDTAGLLRVRLTVDAIGADVAPRVATALPSTGSTPVGPALLAIAAVSAGLAVATLARRRTHG